MEQRAAQNHEVVAPLWSCFFEESTRPLKETGRRIKERLRDVQLNRSSDDTTLTLMREEVQNHDPKADDNLSKWSGSRSYKMIAMLPKHESNGTCKEVSSDNMPKCVFMAASNRQR